MWEKELGPDAGEIHDTWENRIGNLTVTGYNSAYSNSSFQKKKDMPEGFATSPYRLNEDVKSAEHWTEENMRTRSARLVSRALAYWSFAETNFRPPEVARPTEPMGDDASFTGRVVTAYEYGDASETVTDWADLMPKVLGVLLQQDRAGLLTLAETESLLTANPGALEDSRGLRVVDPGLGVWVSTSTNAKIALLRRIFASMGLDTEELVFTLRPVKGDPAERADDAADDSAEVTATGPYASLTKFSDAVAEAAALTSSAETTSELRTEFAGEFTEFRRDTWMQDLGGQPLAAFTATTPVEEMTAEQVLAIITGLFAMETMFGPGAVHQSIVDGTMSAYLRRLAEVG